MEVIRATGALEARSTTFCRPHKAMGIEGVVDIATRHVHCCEIIAKQVIWLRISGVFINTAYDEGLSMLAQTPRRVLTDDGDGRRRTTITDKAH